MNKFILLLGNSLGGVNELVGTHEGVGSVITKCRNVGWGAFSFLVALGLVV